MRRNTNAERSHVPVLLAETLEGLRVVEDGIYLDGTYGRGGHARAVLARLGPHGRLLVMDRDPDAIADAERELGRDPRVAIRHAAFAGLADWEETAGGLDGVLFDLGVSSPQLDEPARGFSFQADGPLDMRMDPTRGTSAADWLAEAGEAEIADVLWRLGEERMSRRIARTIVAARGAAPIGIAPLTTTRQLADLVAKTIGHRERNKHPATRTFQALRIHVNDELGQLERGLEAATLRLKPGGRLAVISFHSLEDRAVKQFIRGEEAPRVRRGLPQPEASPSPLVPVGKAIFASDAETAANPRSRSAVLRVAERRSGKGGA
ncbi:MAG TPA: 16S rRNA (cytosine(1402)-N(4))-methyltransferase RsmH [Rhodanobacteraceae bacterium]|nr:16S rRNA (cytosine(1402)-N(4))-methyltransferase RsmH [Rhodanobacteraceae bacterium]